LYTVEKVPSGDAALAEASSGGTAKAYTLSDPVDQAIPLRDAGEGLLELPHVLPDRLVDLLRDLVFTVVLFGIVRAGVGVRGCAVVRAMLGPPGVVPSGGSIPVYLEYICRSHALIGHGTRQLGVREGAGPARRVSREGAGGRGSAWGYDQPVNKIYDMNNGQRQSIAGVERRARRAWRAAVASRAVGQCVAMMLCLSPGSTVSGGVPRALRAAGSAARWGMAVLTQYGRMTVTDL